MHNSSRPAWTFHTLQHLGIFHNQHWVRLNKQWPSLILTCMILHWLLLSVPSLVGINLFAGLSLETYNNFKSSILLSSTVRSLAPNHIANLSLWPLKFQYVILWCWALYKFYCIDEGILTEGNLLVSWNYIIAWRQPHF